MAEHSAVVALSSAGLTLRHAGEAAGLAGPLAAFITACGNLSPDRLVSAAATATARDLVDALAKLKAGVRGDSNEVAAASEQATEAKEISNAAHAVLLEIAARAASSEGPPLGEPVLALGLWLCTVSLDAAVFRSLAAPGSAEATDVALGFLRCHQSALAQPSMVAVAEEVLKSLGCLVQTRTLDSERLRRTLAIAAEAVALNLANGKGEQNSTLIAGSNTLVAAVAATTGSRAHVFELALEVMLKKVNEMARGGQKVARSLVMIFMRSLAAICAPALIAGPIEEWMPQCHAEARLCGRMMVVALLKCASNSSNDTKLFIESIAAEIAEAAMQPEWPAAALALRSLMGSLTILLQSRGAGDMKILAVRILGRTAASLGRIDNASINDLICPMCAAGHGAAELCEEDKEHHMAPEKCDVCLQRTAAMDLSRTMDMPSLMQGGVWTVRHLVLCATGNDITQDIPIEQDTLPKCSIPTASKRFASASPDLEFACTCSFWLCEWAAQVWPIDATDQQDAECGRRLIAEAWARLATCNSKQVWAAEPCLGPEHATRMLQPYFSDLGKEAVLMQQKAVRSMVLQLRSPRPSLRSTALRALGSVAKAVTTRSAAWKPFPRQVLLNALSKDPSVQVRRSALTIVGQLLLEENCGKEGAATRKWAWGAVRLASADAGSYVRTAACRLLGAFLRQYPEDPSAIHACNDLVAWLVSQGGPGESLLPSEGCEHAAVYEDLRSFIFAGHSGLREGALLQLLPTVHRLGAEDFLAGLLKAHRASHSAESHNKVVKNLAATLVNALAAKPEAATMSGLMALSQAAPWALAEHAPTIAIYLAVGAPPSASEEVLALGACSVLANVLASLGPGATRGLWPSAWARIDWLVLAHGSRLARPAMHCLCAAANAEGSHRPILGHLRAAVREIRTEVTKLRGATALTRAAWIAATVCEDCDLDNLCSLADLGLRVAPAPKQLRTKGQGVSAVPPPGVGAVIAADLLRLYGTLAVGPARDDAALPALVLALGFALRRHTRLAASATATAVFTHGLAASPGSELLAERSLEALSKLLEHFTMRAENEASNATANGTDGPEAGEALSHLAHHQPAVLRLLSHGLYRRAEASDVALRSRALAAARALQRAGLGHPSELAQCLFAPLFADKALRHGSSCLLAALADRNSGAVASVVAGGIREAFAAVLWQAPQQLTLTTTSPGLARGSLAVRRAFAISGRKERERWLRALLGEVHSLEEPQLRSRLPLLPSDLSGATGTRLSPFGGRRVARTTVAEAAGSGSNEGMNWSPSERLSLLFGNFVAGLIAALPLNEAEAELLAQECTRHLELRTAAAASACEHGGGGCSIFGVCAAAAMSRGLVHCLKAEAGAPRTARLTEVVTSQLRTLSVAARGGAAALAEWLGNVVQDMDQPLSSRRRRGRPSKLACPLVQTPRMGSLTPPKRPMPSDGTTEVSEPFQKRSRGGPK